MTSASFAMAINALDVRLYWIAAALASSWLFHAEQLSVIVELR
jgi:hypothetical protein